MRLFTTLLLALALTGAFVAPVGAADRPVGPETGQARVGEDDGPVPGDPDEAEAFDRFGLPGQGEIRLGWNEFWCRVIHVWAGDTTGSRC